MSRSVREPQAYDAVVVGSGFGGAITACRLTQAGRSVRILERGQRWAPKDFPRGVEDTDTLFWRHGYDRASRGSSRCVSSPAWELSRLPASAWCSRKVPPAVVLTAGRPLERLATRHRIAFCGGEHRAVAAMIAVMEGVARYYCGTFAPLPRRRGPANEVRVKRR